MKQNPLVRHTVFRADQNDGDAFKPGGKFSVIANDLGLDQPAHGVEQVDFHFPWAVFDANPDCARGGVVINYCRFRNGRIRCTRRTKSFAYAFKLDLIGLKTAKNALLAVLNNSV